LEGYPRTEGEARSLAEAGLLPDLIVRMTLSPESAERRLLQGQLAAFKAHKEHALAQRQQKVDAKAAASTAKRTAWDAAQAEKRALRAHLKEEQGENYESEGDGGEETYVSEPEEEEDGAQEEVRAGYQACYVLASCSAGWLACALADDAVGLLACLLPSRLAGCLTA